MDIRREPSEEDAAMLEYMNANNIRYFVVFTKCDKFSNAQLRRRIEELKDIYNFDENADIFAVSSMKKQGIEELREAIAKLLI
jgi:GTP-binding protein